MKKMTVKAGLDNLSRVLACVDEELETAGCSMKTQMQVDIAVEEMFVNIANYAYAPGEGDADVCVETEETDGGKRIRITLADQGKPYDPLMQEAPDVSLPAEKRKIGGLGIFMARKNMDDMTYEYRDGRNILTMFKRI
ncbi:MAG: ATP-binding protein [Lachnospiraceae bacterium]|jgi:anti-sigma regulatory factor (Ser/Thr protein kinase)|nr:ATP-binding protein [Lachnospiraceae bacterium]MBR7016719.1 ATP-binding protein [Lachnospiraceae bacterium]MEE3378277.1 ATP-binding protein [Lachnospiraceae bacterium]